jgi:hypothetical protein
MSKWIVALIALAVAVPLPLEAGKKKDKKEKDVVVTFSTHDRENTQVFFVEKHGRGKCPPGLAKKNNGCLPPGQAKKRYSIGHPLPPAIVLEQVPTELTVRIGPAPAGYRYAMVDGDLVKLAVGTLLVVDAIQGLVD